MIDTSKNYKLGNHGQIKCKICNDTGLREVTAGYVRYHKINKNLIGTLIKCKCGKEPNFIVHESIRNFENYLQAKEKEMKRSLPQSSPINI